MKTENAVKIPKHAQTMGAIVAQMMGVPPVQFDNLPLTVTLIHGADDRAGVVFAIEGDEVFDIRQQ